MGNEIADFEKIVRAVPFPKYNADKKKISHQVFMNKEGVSVGRTSILPFEKLTEIFVKDLHKPPGEPLIATVAITVAKIKYAVENPPVDPFATAIVIEDPVLASEGTENPAHALIFGVVQGSRRGLTEGQAKRVLKAADDPVFFEWNP